MNWPEAINRSRRLFMDSDGFVHPITNFYDSEGDEVNEAEHAVFVVAGTEGRWFSLDLREFGNG